MSLNKSLDRRLLIAVCAVLCLVVFGGAFFVGIQVGEFRSSSRSFRKFRQAGFPPHVLQEMRPGVRGFDSQRHGFGGEVLSVGSGTLTVVRRDGTERVIAFTSDTVLENTDLQEVDDRLIGAEIIAIGKPNSEGIIQAKVLILPTWNE